MRILVNGALERILFVLLGLLLFCFEPEDVLLLSLGDSALRVGSSLPHVAEVVGPEVPFSQAVELALLTEEVGLKEVLIVSLGRGAS